MNLTTITLKPQIWQTPILLWLQIYTLSPFQYTDLLEVKRQGKAGATTSPSWLVTRPLFRRRREHHREEETGKDQTPLAIDSTTAAHRHVIT